MVTSRLVAAVALLLSLRVAPAPAQAPDRGGWVELITPDFAAWRGEPKGDWVAAGDVKTDPKSPRKLIPADGPGLVIINGAEGRVKDLLSKGDFGDVELHLEFLVPKGSNSGVKFHGHYEIQIHDSYGVGKLTGEHCGGIYPRATLEGGYRHIDDGIAPTVNACRPAGEWQSLDAVFVAPKFDAAGKKVANARLVRVLLNGELIHEGQELKTPTGHFWTRPEMAAGPLLLQADHGPVAFRSVRVRPYMAGE